MLIKLEVHPLMPGNLILNKWGGTLGHCWRYFC